MALIKEGYRHAGLDKEMFFCYVTGVTGGGGFNLAFYISGLRGWGELYGQKFGL